MKIVVTSTGDDLESKVDPRFGRAARFILYDTRNKQTQVVDNRQGLNASQGAGIQAAETNFEECGSRSCSTKSRRQGESEQEFADRQQLNNRLCRIAHKVLVLSGKGGVGKSTLAVNLAVALMQAEKRVGLLDVDIHGPSVPKMLNLEGRSLRSENDTLFPLNFKDLKVMSIGFLLRDRDDAVIWRGPLKMRVIKQFLKDVAWGDLDYLIVDAPPGTGDEPLSVCQLIKEVDGALIVTTPQEVALSSVRKSISFCRQLKIPVLGVVENMSGFVCPKCGELTEIFASGGGERMALEMKVPFLGRIPVEPKISLSGDAGKPYMQEYAGSKTAKAFSKIIQPILKLDMSPTSGTALPVDT